MNTLQEIKDSIEKDSIINQQNLDHESLIIPNLHSKYYSLMIDNIKAYEKMKNKLNVLLKQKHEYYGGKAGDAVYRSNPLFVKPLKQEIDMYLKADKDLIELESEIFDQKLVVDMLENFIKVLNNRSFMIKNAIEFMKFKQGSL